MRSARARRQTLAACVLAVAATAGCERPAPLAGCGGAGCPPQVSTTWDEELLINYRVDVLFVVDDTPAVEPLRAALADELRGAAAELANAAPGGLPALHVAVVPASLPAGDASACAPTPLRGAACGVEGGLDFASALECGATTDFAGPFADTFSCLADLGSRGCGASQPLEAARRALTTTTAPASLAEFLRADAALQLVFVVNEDDASTVDGALAPVADYVDFLRGLKLDSSKVSVVLAGPSSASAPPSPSTPRLAALLASFGRAATFASLATDGALASALAAADPVGFSVDPGCLTNVRDTDPSTPGLQPDCVVEDFIPQDQSGDDASSVLPDCDHGAPPCWRLERVDSCLQLQITHASPWCPQDGVDARVTCAGCVDPTEPACAGH